MYYYHSQPILSWIHIFTEEYDCIVNQQDIDEICDMNGEVTVTMKNGNKHKVVHSMEEFTKLFGFKDKD